MKALVLASAAALFSGAAPALDLQLWRLDCGTLQIDNLDDFSDTRAWVGQSKRLTSSCYLVRHGGRYLLWDTGLTKADLNRPLTGPGSEGETLNSTIVDQLAKIGVKPAQIEFVGISHYHFDHTGQAADFPDATLLEGKGDLDALRAGVGDRAKPLEHWLKGSGKSQPVTGDKDVFGDGRVVMLDLPGHTPGHHALLVMLPKMGPVLLSGDATHFRENYESDGVPSFNTNRADTLASLHRFKALAKNLNATVIIQHDERDIAKLPAFPASAR